MPDSDKTFDITVKVKKSFIHELLWNLPEYAQYSFRCVDWNYNDCVFNLVDIEENHRYELTLDIAIKGMQIFVPMVINGELPGLEITGGNIFDTADWGAYDMDAYLQVCFFGEVVYG